MLHRPVFAIIVPVYNVALYLKDCIDSLKKQSFKDFVVILVDDGSTDGSDVIAAQVIADDPRFVLLKQSNGGVSMARNKALDYLRQINPEYVGFVDSDDYTEVEWLATVQKALSVSQASLCFFGIQTFDRQGLHDNHSVLTQTECIENEGLLQCYFAHGRFKGDRRVSYKLLCNKIFEYGIIKNLRFDENLKLGEDQKFCLTVMRRIKRAVVVPNNYYFYRMRSSSATNTRPLENLFDVYGVYKEAFLNKEKTQELAVMYAEMLSLYRIAFENCVQARIYDQYRQTFFHAEKVFLRQCSSQVILSKRDRRRLRALLLPDPLLILFIYLRLRLRKKRMKEKRKSHYQ